MRPFSLGDAADVFEYAGDPQVTRFLALETQRSVDDVRRLLATMIAACNTGQVLMVAVELKKKGKVVGGCAMRNWDRESSRLEFAYALAHRYWGQGIIPEALNALIELAFTRMGLNRIEVHTSPDNAASCRMVEKIGFQREGVIRRHEFYKDEYHDLVMYALLRDEWNSPCRRA